MTPKNRQAALSEAIKCIREVCIDGGEWNCAVEFKRHAETLITEAQSTDALRSALKFYANPESYELTDMDDMGTCASPIDLDGGDRAIKALEPAGKEGEE